MYWLAMWQKNAIISRMDAETLLNNTCARLRRHEGSYAEISRRSPGLGYSWLTKLAHGQIKNPTVGSLQLLIKALDAFEGVTAAPAPAPADPGEQDPDASRIVPLETA